MLFSSLKSTLRSCTASIDTNIVLNQFAVNKLLFVIMHDRKCLRVNTLSLGCRVIRVYNVYQNRIKLLHHSKLTIYSCCNCGLWNKIINPLQNIKDEWNDPTFLA